MVFCAVSVLSSIVVIVISVLYQRRIDGLLAFNSEQVDEITDLQDKLNNALDTIACDTNPQYGLRVQELEEELAGISKRYKQLEDSHARVKAARDKLEKELSNTLKDYAILNGEKGRIADSRQRLIKCVNDFRIASGTFDQ